MARPFADEGIEIDGVYYRPYHPDYGQENIIDLLIASPIR
jgi:hypothetical protein